MGIVAAIYARKSTEQVGVSEDQRSVTRRIGHGRAYAAKKGWTVSEADIYIDDGNSSRRACACFYLEDRERRLDSPTDKIMLSLTALPNEVESEKARQRTYDALLREARAGHVVGGGVFGYDNVRLAQGHVERRVNEAEAAVVRRIFDLAANGTGLTRISKMFNAEQAVAPAGRGWSPSTVRDVLHRDLYRDVVVALGSATGRASGRSTRVRIASGCASTRRLCVSSLMGWGRDSTS